MTKFLNISTDNTLGGSSPSNEVVSSQKALKEYIDSKEVSIDNSTITKNSSNELQAVATINTNTASGATNPVYDWVGTLEEYNAQNIATTHPGWICYITDDISGGTSVYTKSETEELFTEKMSNCITEIPQDIKLELNNGTLTLKAGSKVYVPNGAGVFNEVVISNNIDATNYAGTYTEMVVYKSNGIVDSANINKCFSGATAPTFTGQGIWYDTANNLCKFSSNSGSTWTNCSLPLCICNVSSGVRDNMDQIFNGFGYIGSTTFVLPGVKGLIPNGRNADGSCKNTELSFTTTTIHTLDYAAEASKFGFLTYSGIVGYGVYNYYEQDTKPVFSGMNATWFDTKNNVIMGTADGGATWTKYSRIYLGILYKSSNANITDFNPKQSFRAVDYNDTEFIAHQAMPSNKYVNLTLGSSGTTYTAPADGWFCVNKTIGTAYTKVDIINTTAGGLRTQARAGDSTGEWLYCYLPVSKGDSVSVEYSATGTTNFFRFIYANGAA